MKRYPRDFEVTDEIFVPRQTARTVQARDTIVSGSAPDKEFNYSDGTEVEARLTSILQKTRNLSSDSPELEAAVCDWPTRYHLSSERANLLRGLDLRSDAHVLELGCGCGAVTRWLGEHTLHVTAVEGSAARARIAALRCADLNNVDVIASRFDDITFDKPFDLITLIGVLEYSAIYGRSGVDPFVETLRLVHESLRPDGVLLLAIENKLGIKYLAGTVEDHMGQPYVGVEGYPDPLGPRTFGRTELMELLRRCGFEDMQFLLPFPDYKIPSTILNGDRTTARLSRTCNLVDWCRQPYMDYGRNEAPITQFNPHLGLRSFADNGLLAEVSNSFLVLVSKTALTEHTVIPRANWIARKINISRRTDYRSIVTLQEDDGRTVIRKEIAAVGTRGRKKSKKNNKRRPPAAITHHLTKSTPFLEGTVSLAFLMLQALHRTEERDLEFKRLLEGWICFLTASAPDPQQTTVLPSRFVDCVPSNLLVDAAGALHYIDDEWSWREPVRLEWIIWRGLLQFWRENSRSIQGRLIEATADVDDFVDRCMELTGLELRIKDFEPYQEQENRFQKLVLTV